MLIVCGIDIGNRLDISQRVASAILAADAIVVENAQMFQKLCLDLNINTSSQIIEYYNPIEYSLEIEIVRSVTELLSKDKTVILLSDDGMPGMSDPGGRLVHAAHESGFVVSVIPGPSIVSTLPAVTGLNGTRFVYDDEIPDNESDRIARFIEARESKMGYMFIVKNRRDHNSMFFKILNELQDTMGKDRKIGIGINLTMPEELVIMDTISGAINRLRSVRIEQKDFISVYVQEQ